QTYISGLLTSNSLLLRFLFFRSRNFKIVRFVLMPLNQNTVVWASAGTGKTRRLVQTYVELLDAGCDPVRIVAMTFTEKAAAELRDRIRSAITIRMHEAAASERSRWLRNLSVLP